MLEHKFVTCIDRSEKVNDMALLSKAIAMERKITEKQIELERKKLLKENVRTCSRVLELVNSYFEGLYSYR